MKDKSNKILKGVVILIIIIIIISSIIVIKSKFLKAEENTQIECSESQKTEIQNENTIVVGLEKQDEEIETVSNEVKEEIQTQNETIQTTEQITKEYTKQIEQEKAIKKEVNKTTKQTTATNNSNNKTENPSQPVITEQPKVDVPSVDNSKNNTNENSNSVTNQSTPSVQEKNTETKKEETFKYNDAMAQKMIAVIKANESDYMKQYGYTVTIDESITNLTNQFTFTENRIKNSIVYKFGQIRVYARDYYVNGEYRWTECYIL